MILDSEQLWCWAERVERFKLDTKPSGKYFFGKDDARWVENSHAVSSLTFSEWSEGMRVSSQVRWQWKVVTVGVSGDEKRKEREGWQSHLDSISIPSSCW